jgi:hypothetical protein
MSCSYDLLCALLVDALGVVALLEQLGRHDERLLIPFSGIRTSQENSLTVENRESKVQQLPQFSFSPRSRATASRQRFLTRALVTLHEKCSCIG